MKKKQIIIIISILAVALLFIIGNIKQQAITTSQFNTGSYIIEEQDVKSVIIKFTATAESDISDNSCQGEENYPLPAAFFAENFQHLVQPTKNLELLNSLDKNYYQIISYQVNDGITGLNSCIGHPESIPLKLNFISGECQIVNIQDRLALNCREIKASLIGKPEFALRGLNKIEIKVKILKEGVSQEIKENILISPDLQLITSPPSINEDINLGGYNSSEQQSSEQSQITQKITIAESEKSFTELFKEKLGIDIGLFIGLIFIIILVLILIVIIIRKL